MRARLHEVQSQLVEAEGDLVAERRWRSQQEAGRAPGRCPKPACKRVREEVEELREKAAARPRLQPVGQLRASVAEHERQKLEAEHEVMQARRARKCARAAADAATLEAAEARGRAAAAEAAVLGDAEALKATQAASAAAAAASAAATQALAVARKQKAEVAELAERHRLAAEVQRSEAVAAERQHRVEMRELQAELDAAGVELEEVRGELEEARVALRESKAGAAKLEKEAERLRERSSQLTSINITRAKKGSKYKTKSAVAGLPSSSPLRPMRGVRGAAASGAGGAAASGAAASKAEAAATRAAAAAAAAKKNETRKETRRVLSEAELVAEFICEGRSPLVVAEALEMCDLVDALMSTPEFWRRRILQAQQVVDVMNAHWNGALTARIKCDYLLSNRDLDGIRTDLSHDIINGKPRPKILLFNPHRPTDRTQRVFFAEPVPPRNGKRGWAEQVKAQTEIFGLEINPDHRDAAERDFNVRSLSLLP